MTQQVVVIGSGIGGLSAAIHAASAGLRVHVLEAMDRPGGKANIAVADGLEVDTGPSVMTLLDVWQDLFRVAGTQLQDELGVVRFAPVTRYQWTDGCRLDVHDDPADTLQSVRDVLGPAAAHEFAAFLEYARTIWDAAAPHFVLGAAPTPSHLARILPAAWPSLLKIDPLRTMDQATLARLREPHLRDLVRRFATYNGSDPRSAPATLHCITHVELGLGMYGVDGGIYALVRALVRVAERLGVTFSYAQRVSAIAVLNSRVKGVATDTTTYDADHIICNADVSHLVQDLLPSTTKARLRATKQPSMSGWTGIVKARRAGHEDRAPHAVLFGTPYTDEFVDIFDRARPPQQPTVYQCAQSRSHRRPHWGEHEPLFIMTNAPPEPSTGESPRAWWQDTRETAHARLVAAGLIDADDEIVWERTPSGLAKAFPGSRGAIYGAASNDMLAAFRRPPNQVAGIHGLYLASGSAHPGGGLPLCALSGKAAAAAVVRNSR